MIIRVELGLKSTDFLTEYLGFHSSFFLGETKCFSGIKLTDPDPALDEDGWRHDSIGRSYSFEAGNVALGKAGDRLVGERLLADQPVRL